MSSCAPRLPLQLDPLIAEARRRARRRRVLACAVLLLVAAGLTPGLRAVMSANANAAVASSGRQCTPSTAYGTECIDVRGAGLRVQRIQTSFDNTGMFWPADKWRIDLERYDCDPVGKTKAACWALATWHGKTRTGAVIGPRNTALSAHSVQSRSRSYWPTFSLPHRFASDLWLCTEVAAYNAARRIWVYNGGGLSHGLRSCVSVHR
ncbi:MAG: hypothetical protein ACXVY6_03215 [Gaiellaceae bacterium]